MAPHPLDAIGKIAPELVKTVSQGRQAAFQDGALSAKTKLLVALALDAAHGAENGVASLARQALERGATKEEIAETVAVVHYICGVGAVYTASRGLAGVV